MRIPSLPGLLLGLLLLPISTLSYGEVNLPDLGSSDLKEYDKHTEQALGRAFTTTLHTQYPLFEDPEILSYIRRIGNRIVSETGNERDFSFYIIQNSEINAFAGPNGVIGIHTGLIEAAESEDELASVIAHEVAHVTQKHLSRSFEYQQSTSLSSIATLIAALLIGSQDTNAGIATYLGGASLSMENALKHSRIHEHEADYMGIQYLYKSGYSPYAMGRFFGKLSKKYQLNEFKPPEILMTHPVSDKRLAQADDRAASFPPFIQSANQSSEFSLIKLRLAYLQNNLNAHNQTFNNLERCYFNALNAHQQNAVKLPCQASQLPKVHRLLNLIQIPIEAKSTQQALNSYQTLRAYYPNDFAILLREAEYQQTHQGINAAIDQLLALGEQYTSKYLIYQKLAELYGLQDQPANMNLYQAKANLEIGNLDKANYLLNQAMQIAEQTEDIRTQNKAQQLLAQIGQGAPGHKPH